MELTMCYHSLVGILCLLGFQYFVSVDISVLVKTGQEWKW